MKEPLFKKRIDMEDPGVIITIVIVSVVGGIAVVTAVYIFMKKRTTP